MIVTEEFVHNKAHKLGPESCRYGTEVKRNDTATENNNDQEEDVFQDANTDKIIQNENGKSTYSNKENESKIEENNEAMQSPTLRKSILKISESNIQRRILCMIQNQKNILKCDSIDIIILTEIDDKLVDKAYELEGHDTIVH